MAIIDVEHLTKDYGHGRGVFDVSVYIDQGECYGFLGPNGAGKSTTIRHLMGFSKPQKGKTMINGLDTWNQYAILQNTVGYLPGEIAMSSGMTGAQFLKMMQKMRGMTDTSHLEELLHTFGLNPNIRLKRMSLGTKRKLAIVTAFMHNPSVLVLDEPTSGLDPIMQEVFLEFILGEMKRGKTIFLSSHIFHEVDAACNRIAIIRDGAIVSEFEPYQLKRDGQKIYQIMFGDRTQWNLFTKQPYCFSSINQEKRQVRVQIKNNEIQKFITQLSNYHVVDFTELPFSLEDYFMQFYEEDKVFEGMKR